jgi:hypothetical protein
MFIFLAGLPARASLPSRLSFSASSARRYGDPGAGDAPPAARHRPVYNYNYNDHGYGKLLHSVPGAWYLYDADPWAPQQVMLSVGPVWPQPGLGAPSADSPVPSPSATR